MMEAFKARLLSLGFDHAIEHKLSAYCCFAPEQMELTHRLDTDDAKCFFSVQCLKGVHDDYDPISFTATLIKLPVVSAEGQLLSEQCAKIDWDAFCFYRKHGSGDTDLLKNTAAVGIVGRLLEEDVTGALRFRHWIGTALEAFIPNLVAFKSELEISQRFYLAGQPDPVKFAEALRFLQSKWTERRMLADRKALLQKKESTGGGGRLLAKRVRPGNKPSNHDQ
jgi:hypothetical protein